MKVLILHGGHPPEKICDYFRMNNIDFGFFSDPIEERLLDFHFTHVLSWCYHSIIPKWFLEKFPHRIWNMHFSYLPWGRGADPNFWSWVKGEPHGITLHEIDEKVDHGLIVFQKKIPFPFPEKETLRTSYEKKWEWAETIFLENSKFLFDSSQYKTLPKTEEKGSYHWKSEKDPIPKNFLDLSISDLCAFYSQLWLQFELYELNNSFF